MEMNDELKNMLRNYLKSAQNALVNVTAEITKVENARQAQLKQIDDALTFYKKQEEQISKDVGTLMAIPWLANEITEAEKARLEAAATAKPDVDEPVEGPPEDEKPVDGPPKDEKPAPGPTE